MDASMYLGYALINVRRAIATCDEITAAGQNIEANELLIQAAHELRSVEMLLRRTQEAL